LSSLTLIATHRGGAQVPTSNLGLTAVGGLGVHAGGASLERNASALEAGAVIDLGWMRGRAVRLQAEVSILRAQHEEYVEVEDSTFSGHYMDLSAGASVMWLGAPDGRLSPYVLGGISVHALSSAFGPLALDRRYNTNRFGSHIGAGLRFRASGVTSLFVEGRRVIADEVDRTAYRAGLLVLLGDLAHAARRTR
jgi:hypothetical protein